MKKALITGVTGQDGAYLAELLLAKGYEVHGIKRRTSLFNTARIDHIYEDPHNPHPKLILHYGDMTDSTSLLHIMQKVQPDEVYNLAAQSHVQVSFEEPEYTANSDAVGVLRLLEAIRILGLEKKTRFYQASTSELYGLVQEIPQRETTPFYPRSPYAVAKLYGYWIVVNYREAYGIYACNGILFNHESPLRGETFVTRKITRGLARIKLGLQEQLFMGNLDAKRDWGHARDYVEMQWLMLQQEKPQDFVIATGRQYSVRDFIQRCAERLELNLTWQGSGVEEKAVNKEGKVVVAVDPRYFRPTEVETLLGDPSKAKDELGWTPRTSFEELVAEMVDADLSAAKRDALVLKHGFTAYNVRESLSMATLGQLMLDLGASVYVAGHRGLVGSAIVRELRRLGFTNVLTRTHAELDLTDGAAVEAFFAAERPAYVFLAAAKVGGILANSTYPADFIRENLDIQNNVIEASFRHDVARLLFLGSSCIYPKLCPQPIKEEYLLTGLLEPTNRPYALAKIAGIEMCWSYNRQYGTRYLAAMPTNLYGPDDNFDLNTSHVLPALMRKAHTAKANGATTMEVWGSGTPRRELLYSDDLAKACVYLMQLEPARFDALLNEEQAPLVNIGTGVDCTIRELAETVAGVVGFQGELVFDTTKPDGTPRKLMDVARMHDLGWHHTVELQDGVRRTYEAVKQRF